MGPLALLDFGRRSKFVIFSLSNSEIFSNSMIFKIFLPSPEFLLTKAGDAAGEVGFQGLWT